VETVVYVIAYALGNCISSLLIYVPLWLALGGLVYLIGQLLGGKPRFFQVVFQLVGNGSSGFTHPLGRIDQSLALIHRSV
jgi:hypothetical protein